MRNNAVRDTQQHAMYGGLASSEERQPVSGEGDVDKRYWLRIAEECHRSSTDYLDQNYRARWEKNMAHWNSEHAKDSPFHRDAYRNRNKLFRPKTRAIAIKSEAAMVRALFGTDDLINVDPENEADPVQRISAEINQELLQYRLGKSVPWYATVIGAWQDAFNFGFCVSYQYWMLRTVEREVALDAIGEDGLPQFAVDRRVVENKPAIDLIQSENFRFDPAADWRDVVGTSPFLERIVPMPLQDVMAKMAKGEWYQHSEAQVIAASRGYDETESLRRARAGARQEDPYSRDRQIPDQFETVFCREYFIREESGEDMVFWTIGHQILLTDPVPIEEAYFHGRRPFVFGTSLLEAHKTIPKSRNELIAPLQADTNKLVNQRRDNVDLVLNKRYFLRRGQNIDTMALMRNVPGGGVYTDDPEKDVKIITTPDVTSSSYEEHNRLSVEIDELAGNFSSASVQSNRQLNETVGGMQQLRAAGDEITEYAILTFVKSWVEPVLRQLVLLEQAYEDDMVILQLAAGKSQMYQKTNLNGDIPLQLLMQELAVTVNVGVGTTDPVQRAQKFGQGIAAVLGVMPHMAQRLDEEAVIKYFLGGLGRNDGSQFFKFDDEQQQPPVDPATAAAQAEAQGKQQEIQAKMELERYKADQAAMLRMVEIQHEDERHYAKLALDRDMTLEKLYAEIGKSQQAAQAKDVELRLRAMAEGNKLRELNFKAQTGRDGI